MASSGFCDPARHSVICRNLRALAQPIGSAQPQPRQQLSFMCKNAIARGDSGAVSTFC